MLDVKEVVSTLTTESFEGSSFQPSDINLKDYFAEAERNEEQEEPVSIDITEGEGLISTTFNPVYPKDQTVIAIDATGFCLGHISDGVIGTVRTSVVTKPAGMTSHTLERYGPYLFPVTNQNKNHIYRNLYRIVFERETKIEAPNCTDVIGHVRNFLEKHIQLEVIKSCANALILLDGGLVKGTVFSPMSFLQKALTTAAKNRNSIVAISKSTGLTLYPTMRSVLSLLDDAHGPCYVGDVKKHLSGNKHKYLGEIYVAKLTPLGETFKIDVPNDAPLTSHDILSKVAGLAGDYGYPEELKLAHMTCILGSLEIIELQASAIAMYGLQMKEELRKKLFPL